MAADLEGCPLGLRERKAWIIGVDGQPIDDSVSRLISLNDHRGYVAGELYDIAPGRARTYVSAGRKLLGRLGAWPWAHAPGGRLPADWRNLEAFLSPLEDWHARERRRITDALRYSDDAMCGELGELVLRDRARAAAADTVEGWRLDQLRAAVGKQLLADAVLATLDLCDVLGQPSRQHFGVCDAALPEAGVGTDLGAVALRRAAGEVIRRQLAGGNADLAGEVRDGVVGQILRPRREAPAPDHVLQQDRESQTRRTGLVAQPLQLVAIANVT